MSDARSIENYFLSEDARHKNAVEKALDSIAENVAFIKTAHMHGQSVAYDLRNLAASVIRAADRASVSEALWDMKTDVLTPLLEELAAANAKLARIQAKADATEDMTDQS